MNNIIKVNKKPKYWIGLIRNGIPIETGFSNTNEYIHTEIGGLIINSFEELAELSEALVDHIKIVRKILNE